MNYGSYSTIDVPFVQDNEKKTLEYQEKALKYLQEEFEKIGGKVRMVMNPHDFGSYPSFEIDYPDEIEDIVREEDALDENNLEELDKLIELDEWRENANQIEKEYCNLFQEGL